jgi:hypothetical protein
MGLESQKIPLKEIRGWTLIGGNFHPFSREKMGVAHNTDPKTSQILAPEKDCYPMDAWEITV